MKKTYYFGKDKIEFERWCHCIKECKTYINNYRHMPRYMKLGNIMLYHECRLVVDQYKILISSLNKREINVLQSICRKKYKYTEEHFSCEIIYSNWLEIVFPLGESRLVSMSSKETGKKLKDTRVKAGYLLEEVARITEIPRRTLQRYENGEFLPRFDYAYILFQIYCCKLDF